MSWQHGIHPAAKFSPLAEYLPLHAHFKSELWFIMDTLAQSIVARVSGFLPRFSAIVAVKNRSYECISPNSI
jgi:hypothetical protein